MDKYGVCQLVEHPDIHIHGILAVQMIHSLTCVQAPTLIQSVT